MALKSAHQAQHKTPVFLSQAELFVLKLQLFLRQMGIKATWDSKSQNEFVV